MINITDLKRYFPHAVRKFGQYVDEFGRKGSDVPFYRLSLDGKWLTERETERELMRAKVNAKRALK